MLRLQALKARVAEAADRAGAEAAIDRFLAEHRVPLVDEEGVIFLYRDEKGDLDRVRLVHEIAGLESRQDFERLGDTSLHYLAIDVPQAARIEYRLETVRGGRSRVELDPRNPERSDCPYGEKSVVTAHGYQTPPAARRHEDVPRGRIETFQVESRVFGERRRVQVWLPARFRRDREYPVLIVHDGSDYRRFARLDVILDNLTHSRQIADLVVVLTDSPNRLVEYRANPIQGDFLVRDLLPFIESRFLIAREPSGRGLMGASYGGLTSLHTAFRYPEVFGKVLSQSGSFLHSDVRRRPEIGGDVGAEPDVEDEDYAEIARFVAEFRSRKRTHDLQLFLSCGRFEPLVFYNRSLLRTLDREGYRYSYEESYDGHNWTSWRDRLPDGLTYLFPGEAHLYYP